MVTSQVWGSSWAGQGDDHHARVVSCAQALFQGGRTTPIFFASARAEPWACWATVGAHPPLDNLRKLAAVNTRLHAASTCYYGPNNALYQSCSA